MKLLRPLDGRSTMLQRTFLFEFSPFGSELYLKTAELIKPRFSTQTTRGAGVVASSAARAAHLTSDNPQTTGVAKKSGPQVARLLQAS